MKSTKLIVVAGLLVVAIVGAVIAYGALANTYTPGTTGRVINNGYESDLGNKDKSGGKESGDQSGEGESGDGEESGEEAEVIKEEIAVNAANFDEVVLQSKLPVLVDFSATWCGPCQNLAPYVAQAAEDYAGKLIVAKIDIDESEALANKYGIVSIPTLFIFKDGTPVAKSVGAVPQATLYAFIDNNI